MKVQTDDHARYDEGKRRLGGLAAIILMGFFGLGIGWLAGKALTDTIPTTPAENGSTDADSVPAQPDVRPQPDPQPPVAKPEPPKENAEKDSDDTIVIPTDERSAKEAGRKALRKVLKEIENRIGGGKHKDKKEKQH